MTAINLQKGQRVSIGLKRVVVGLGWDPNDSSQDFDLDASAFMIGGQRKVPDPRFMVFYNNQTSADSAVVSTGDDTTGGNSDGDDESLKIDLEKVDKRVEEIVFVVSIHEAEARRQNFGQVRNAFIRIYDATNESNVLCRYDLSEDFSLETCVEFGRLYRKDGQWKFEAIGRGYRGGLQTMVDKYV